MESDATQFTLVDKLWVWGDKNKKQLQWGLGALIVVGIIAAFWLAHKNESQNDASFALSKLTTRTSATAPDPTPDDYLKITSSYPGTDAAQRALLLAAGGLFTEGKYDVAQTQFQNFLQQYSSSPLVSQAALGVAACLDAQGKTNDAVSAYDSVVNRYPTQNVVPQAKLGMARLLEAQGKFKEARAEYEDLGRMFAGTISSEANTRLQELNAAHPELQPTNALPQIASPNVSVAPTTVTPLPPAHPAATTTNLKVP